MIRDMNEKTHDFSKVLTEAHADKWVAFSPDYTKVLAYSNNILDVQKAIQGKDVVYFKVPAADTIYAFSATL